MIEILATTDPGFDARFTRLVERNAISPAGEPLVSQIVEDVRRRGDEALLYWTQKLDGVVLRAERLAITPDPATLEKLEPRLRTALETAAERIRAYHERSLPTGWFAETEPGVRLGVRWRPLDRVGVYVPGGKAAYPSTVLMCAIPARVAGVGEVVMVTPPRGRHLPLILEAAAALAGVDRIYTVGGVQAVAALAFGTATLPKVDKVVGPGNRYVAEAKRLLFGIVDIDSVAGPSEVCIVTDGSADARWLAADAIAQAEHDEAATVLVLALDRGHLEAIDREVERLLEDHPRREIAAASLRSNGLGVVCRDLAEVAELVDRFAPEHLEVALTEPEAFAERVRHAGAIFLGAHTPEALGDYVAGPNHVLPTQGTARFFSPLGVEDFLKRSSLLHFTAEACARYAEAVEALAEAEGLVGHAESVRIRRQRP